MKLSIGHRLFAAVLLAFLAVAGAWIGVVRWQWFGATTGGAAWSEGHHNDALVAALGAQYREHGSWSFLPSDPTRRDAWLREQVLRSRPAGGYVAPAAEFRTALLDREHHHLAGPEPGGLLIAFASVDTLHQPIEVDGRVVGFLRVSGSYEPGDELAIAFLIEQQRHLAAMAAIGVILVALAAAGLAAHFRRPIVKLAEGARRLEGGRFDTRLAIARRDELGHLADAFNSLAARLEDADRSRRQWIADTSHELRTPLAVLRGQIEALLDGVRTATPDHLALMLRQVQVLTGRVEDLYDLARADVGQLAIARESVDAWPLLGECVDAFADRANAASLVLELAQKPSQSRVRADPARLRQVFVNLLENAVRCTAAGGRIEVHAEISAGELRIAFDDSAPGVPADALARLGERFFRLPSSQVRDLSGAGLGLALCRRIVEMHEGRLEFAASPLGGLRAVVALPLES